MNNLKISIDKQFHWEGGHRVWSQVLDSNFTEGGNTCAACRHLHGHSYKLKVFLEEDIKNGLSNVQTTGMVTDFKHLGFVKEFIDNVLDHKFLIDLNDPLIGAEFPLLKNEEGKISYTKYVENINAFLPDLNIVQDKIKNEYGDLKNKYSLAVFEKYEGIVFTDFIPTAENIAKWLYDIINAKISLMQGVRLQAIELWETEKSHCGVEKI